MTGDLPAALLGQLLQQFSSVSASLLRSGCEQYDRLVTVLFDAIAAAVKISQGDFRWNISLANGSPEQVHGPPKLVQTIGAVKHVAGRIEFTLAGNGFDDFRGIVGGFGSWLRWRSVCGFGVRGTR